MTDYSWDIAEGNVADDVQATAKTLGHEEMLIPGQHYRLVLMNYNQKGAIKLIDANKKEGRAPELEVTIFDFVAPLSRGNEINDTTTVGWIAFKK